MNIRLNSKVEAISGVGPEIARKLNSAGISTVLDLINYWPKRYEDYTNVVDIANCPIGSLTIKAKITRVKSRYVRRGMHITEALATDSTGSISIVWFNQPYRAKNIKNGYEYYISGVFDTHGGRLSVANPNLLEPGGESVDLIIPVYPENKLLTSAVIRRIIKKIQPLLLNIPETLPEIIIRSNSLLSRSEALSLLHFPKTNKDIELARKRLAFEELFQMQLATVLLKNDFQAMKAEIVPFKKSVVTKFLKLLNFDLTDDQKRTAWQVYKDMSSPTPMNRLIEGDVGSGKTLVAAMAAIMAVDHNFQVLFMAPTEILARQHYTTLKNIFKGTKYEDLICVLTGKIKKTEREDIYNKIKNSSYKIIIGTSAIIQEKLLTSNVALVIVDEQHRFGVNQRQKLRQKGGLFPHFLAMTATPIPRSLALTLYGEVDLSLIKTMPKGRLQTITEITPYSSRHQLYLKINKLIEHGNQVYIVCPTIDESEVLSVTAAEKLYIEVKNNQLKNRKIALLHGKMKAEDKESIMQNFKDGLIDVLVATTVIEVGVDVPNASIIIIEGAERFGLAQLHQLRGRVGRGGSQGYCYLIPSQDIGETKRLKAVTSTNDGFKLAEMDLDIRGPGAIYGTRQSGLLDLRIAKLDDRQMIIKAKKAAVAFCMSNEDMLKYDELNNRVKHFQSLTKLN